MAASATDPSSSSISSTGHVDGLGRRSLSFDRETGEMLERVHVQPVLLAFEPLIRERVKRLVTFDDDRFARPARVERDAATGELTVLAEFITGSRLSDLLEATAESGIVPGVDVALGYLLESLPALTLLHTTGGMAHGLIDASRTVLTPDGQVVFLDPGFGSAVEALGLSRQRLWSGFGVASPAGSGAVHFDAASDITQVALGAVALVLGRNLRPDEYPEALPSLLMEVIEVAQIRGTSGFATGLQRFLQRSLPLPGRRAYVTADEAAADVRQLVRREIGVDVCRLAVVDFAAQMDAAFLAAPTEDDSTGTHAAQHSTHGSTTAYTQRVPELDQFLDDFNAPAKASSAPAAVSRAETPAIDATDDDSDETEISLDILDTETRVAPDRDREEFYDLPPLDEVMAVENMLSPATTPRTSYTYTDPEPVRTSERAAPRRPEAFSSHAADFAPLDDAPVDYSTIDYPPIAEAAEPVELDEAPAPPAHEPEAEVPAFAAVAALATAAEPEVESETEPDKDSAPSRRRKRQQQKSARARKDKLRSSTAGVKMPPPPVPPPEPARPASPTGWLVSPQRAAQFEPPVPVPQPVHVAPPPARSAPVPAMPSFVPTPVGPLPQPIYPSGSQAPYGTPSKPPPARPGPLAPPTPVQHPGQPAIQVKVKAEPPQGFTPRKLPHAEPPPVRPPDRFGTLGLGGGDLPVDDEPRRFPAKLAAIAVGVAVVAVFLGRSYLPGRTAVTGEPGAQAETPAAAPSSPSTTPPPSNSGETSIPAGRGRLVVQTQPPGIKVLLDRKAVGETPLKIDVTPGRRILTFLTTGGEVMRSVRVVAGKTETLDIPVFSGWVAVFAPIVLQVSADGRSLGTTEQNRLMLPPGTHQLTLTNKELGYSSTQQVEIEPGEVKTINIEPRGTVSLNAVPWAEVWLEGRKLGDTPLASTPVPLGVREFVFKNPQFGERKVTATVKAGAPSLVTVDFSK
jgi:hypothetical protein